MTALEQQKFEAALALLLEMDKLKTQMNTLHQQMVIIFHEALVKPDSPKPKKTNLVRIK